MQRIQEKLKVHLDVYEPAYRKTVEEYLTWEPSFSRKHPALQYLRHLENDAARVLTNQHPPKPSGDPEARFPFNIRRAMAHLRVIRANRLQHYLDDQRALQAKWTPLPPVARLDEMNVYFQQERATDSHRMILEEIWYRGLLHALQSEQFTEKQARQLRIQLGPPPIRGWQKKGQNND